MEKHYTYADLCAIMARLRGENGCPWDRQQTHESLRGAIIEEVYEFADALDEKDAAGMCEELGDVLMLTVFHSNLAEESGLFTNADVLDGICRKMIARHSHVFGEDKAANAEEALRTWEQNKYAEKEYTSATDVLRGVPRAFPALMRAQKVQTRAAREGLTPEADVLAGTTAAFDKLTDALRALEATDLADIDALTAAIGNALWQITDFSRLFKINAEFALTNAVETFINRFEAGELNSHQ